MWNWEQSFQMLRSNMHGEWSCDRIMPQHSDSWSVAMELDFHEFFLIYLYKSNFSLKMKLFLAMSVYFFCITYDKKNHSKMRMEALKLLNNTVLPGAISKVWIIKVEGGREERRLLLLNYTSRSFVLSIPFSKGLVILTWGNIVMTTVTGSRCKGLRVDQVGFGFCAKDISGVIFVKKYQRKGSWMKQGLPVLDFCESFKIVQKQVYFESEPFCKIACPVFFYKKPLKKGMEFKFIE